MNPRDRLQALLLPAYAAGVALVAFTTVYLAAHYGAQVSERCQGPTCQLWQVRVPQSLCECCMLVHVDRLRL
jgi:hypothetical protein